MSLILIVADWHHQMACFQGRGGVAFALAGINITSSVLNGSDAQVKSVSAFKTHQANKPTLSLIVTLVLIRSLNIVLILS